eukprot:TRINITY_DN214_c0_g1_i1.p2 TRINITY_DN214_c0_g1~~TRINITY_DN214_c0_g1_i1.p2  ORF type:complete len:225 (-),score=7.47 TRINITY_DN214_c0_g1_i1:273-914(-)
MWLLALVYALAMSFAGVTADPDALQDFCVGSGTTPLSGNTWNGFPCKLSSEVNATDFKFTALAKASDPTGTQFGNVFTPGSVHFFPGVNTLGLGTARIDFAFGGINPPHLHPRTSELFYVLEGTFEVGFISGNANTLYKETVTKGEVFVFPRALVHYQRNIALSKSVAIAFFNSQNAGSYSLPVALKSFPKDLILLSFKDLFLTPHTTSIYGA